MSERPREAQPAPLALLLGGGRARAGPSDRGVEGHGRPLRRARARPARAGGGAGGARTQRRAREREEAEDEAEQQGRRRRRPSAAQTSRWGVQVSSTVKLEPPSACRSAAVDLPSVGEPVDQLRASPGRRVCDPAAAPGPGVATACQPLLTLWPSTSSKGCGGAGHVGPVAVDVRRTSP